MRYFNVDQIYADLITGRTTRTLVYSSLVRARKSEQPDRVEMFEKRSDALTNGEQRQTSHQ
jgi:hypothetical protein